MFIDILLKYLLGAFSSSFFFLEHFKWYPLNWNTFKIEMIFFYFFLLWQPCPCRSVPIPRSPTGPSLLLSSQLRLRCDLDGLDLYFLPSSLSPVSCRFASSLRSGAPFQSRKWFGLAHEENWTEGGTVGCGNRQ